MIKNSNLDGIKVALTRSREQSTELREKIEALGAQVVELPLIKVSPYSDPVAIEEVLSEIGSYEWIVFTSRNGVQCFFDFFFHRFKDIRCIGGMKIACIGQGTAAEIAKYHLEVDFMPKEALSENLAEELIEDQTMDNTKVLVITGNLNSDTLVEILENKGHAIVDTLKVYQTILEDLTDIVEVETFKEQGADVIVFASSSAVNAFVQQVQSLILGSQAKKPLTCSIGPSTSKTMQALGISVNMEAEKHTVEGLVEVLQKQLGHK